MPAVSVRDSLAVAIRHNLDTAGQSKSDDLNMVLASNGPRMLHSELDFEETDNFRSTVQDRLKSKYVVLSVPKESTDNGKAKDGAGSSKNFDKSKEPRLPEPTTVLYPPDKVKLGWSNNFPIGAGMYNVGNTCYLNSTLQALFHVPALVNWLVTDPHHDSKCDLNEGGGECLTCAVAKTLHFSHQKSGDSIKPYCVYNKLKLICKTMVQGQQEDAHEFLRYLLEGMEKAYLARHKGLRLDNYSKETTPINQIFGGYIRTEVKCLQCRHVSTTFQHFQDLLLDIRKSGTLDEALAGYFSQEQLDNNDYKCEACKRRVPATKQFILERPPKVLCVQLKRFSVLGGKISRHIGFVQTIDMGPYIRRQPGETPSKVIYRLTSMVTHMGPWVNSGHYTAIAQVSSGKFYSFDDSCVRQISLNNVLSTNAYIMIFEMEPSHVASNGQTHSSQSVSMKNDVSISKAGPSYSHTNGVSSKVLDNGNNKQASFSNKNCESSSPSTKSRDRENAKTPSPPPPPPVPPLAPPNYTRRNFIGPQMPPHMEKNRLNDSTNNKLVDYDNDSSDEENPSSKTSRQERDSYRFSNTSSNNSSMKYSKTNGNAYSYSSSSHNGNSHHSYSNGSDANNGGSSENSNGSSSRSSSPKSGFSNNKSEYNGSASEKGKDKWHYSKSRGDSSERKVYTKASANVNNKGWQVCKDTPSPSSATNANGWSVSDNVSDEPNGSSNRSNNHSMTPSAAEMRNFNGTNRSETVSHLQKTSQWAYGNTNVNSWNGGKARIDREVDNQRRQDHKRSYDNDEDDLDRGRTKKVKIRHDYKSSNDYNRFQDHQNNKVPWRQSNPFRQNMFYNRSRNHRSQHHRYPHNKSRNDWR